MKAIFTADFMSSEESDQDDPNTHIKRVVPWRSDKVNDFFHQVDKKREESMFGQAKRQRKFRSLGEESPKPPHTIPSWSIKGQYICTIMHMHAVEMKYEV